jgi:hypothetical protein
VQGFSINDVLFVKDKYSTVCQRSDDEGNTWTSCSSIPVSPNGVIRKSSITQMGRVFIRLLTGDKHFQKSASRI